MVHKVGRYTLAAGLILLGGALLLDNLRATQTLGYVVHLWPVLLILLGIEWIYVSARVPEGERVRVDGGAIALLLVIALGASAFSAATRVSLFSPGSFRVDVGAPQIAIPNIPDLFGNVSAEVTRTYAGDAGPMNEVAVTASSGDITVIPADKFKVEMRVQAYGRTAEEAEQTAQQVQLQVIPGSSTQVRSVTPPGITRISVSFQVFAPAGVGVRLHSSSGNVGVQNRNGAVYAESSSGNVQIAQIRGNVDLRASSGTVTATDIDGDAFVTTSSGSIRITAARGAVKANATSGAVSIEQPQGPVSAQASSGNVTVTADRVGGNYDLTASSGEVRLTIPADASVAVSARASSGNVSGPSWLTIGEGRNSGNGANAGGQYRVTLQSSSGNINVTTR